MFFHVSSLNTNLSKQITSFFGLKAWLLILICIALFLLLLLCFLSLFILLRRRPNSPPLPRRCPSKPAAPKHSGKIFRGSSLDARLLSPYASRIEKNSAETERRVAFSGEWSAQETGTIGADLDSVAWRLRVLSDPRCGNYFPLREIKAATYEFANENLIGAGHCGIVYRGVLSENTPVAVKLLSNSCQVEEFKVEVRIVGHARHKNLVKLLGYCMEGDQRMLICEYIANGDLHQWLHGHRGRVSPLTWGRRMNIIIGMAKGLAYLHEDIEPKIVHQGLKSSNILLDHQWNPKISDFGLAKLFGPEWNHLIAHTMRTSGYVAPECASTAVLTEKSDVYSFGILVMEIISGRTPIDYNKYQECLIDWIKSMVARQNFDHVVDSKLRGVPSLKELKRILLIALRCVDPDPESRPKMGDVIHMLEPRDLLLYGEHQIRRAASCRNYPTRDFNCC